jgi:tetratricopeptide (TPR) repeat protein
MASQFCSKCGAKLLANSSFCVECGERQGGASVSRSRSSASLQRYAPLFVVVAVVAVLGGVVVIGSLSPKTAPSVPRRGESNAAGPGEAAGKLPEGHPPIAIPEEVKQAIREMSKKASAAPDDLDTWKHLADVQYRASEIDPSYLAEADAAYRHVLERHPEDTDVLRSLGNIAFDQQHHDVAIDFYQRYLKLKPDDPDVQTDLGTMLLAAGNMDQAIQQFQAVMKHDPSFFQAQFNLAIAYNKAGQNDKAIEALEKSRPLAKDDRTRGQVDEVLAQLKGMPPRQPTSGEAPAMGAPPAMGGGSESAAAGASAPIAATFQAGMEAYFHQHPILGPKLDRIEWQGPESAKVYLRDFPMDQMPAEMVGTFADRVKATIKTQKEAHKVTQAARVELVDNASGKVMSTITE